MSLNNEFDLVNYLTVERERGTIIWMFNIGIEKFWNNENFSLKDVKENAIVNRIEEMNLLLTRKQDILILRNKPDSKYLKDLEDLGFDIPIILSPQMKDDEKSIAELVLNDTYLLSELKELSDHNKELYFVPYGVSSLEEEIARRCDLTIVGATSELNKKINNKVFSRRISEALELTTTEGCICNSLEEVEAAYHKLKKKFDKIIIKQPCGASGKGLYIVENDRKFKSTSMILSRFERINQESEWIVEGWYDKKADINYQIYVSESGEVTTFSVKEQIVDKTIYVGSVMPPRISDDIYNQYIKYGDIIGKELYAQGFTGILGIDSIITSEDIVIPIIEINARFTLSTYVSFLKNKYPNKKMYSFYERIHLTTDMNYEKFQKILIDSDIVFDKVNKHGVLCYVSATLKIDDDNRSGRLFAVVMGDNGKQLEEYKKKIDIILQNMKSIDGRI